jgi:hypothetical protein
MSKARLIATLSVIALASVVLSGCSGSDAIVARVGNRAISSALLNHWTAVDAAAKGRTAHRAASRQRALELLIASRWLTGEAAQLGVTVSASQAHKQLQLLIYDQIYHSPYDGLPHDPQVRAYLTSSKVARADREWLMKLALLAAQIERQRRSQASQEVTRRQIADFYARHQRRFWEPERRDIEIFESFTRGPALKAKREVEAGKSFLSVAKRMSRITYNPEAPDGLMLGFARGDEEKPFEAVIFSAKPHVLIGPVEYAYFYVFKVLRIKPAHERPLADVEAKIRQTLASQRASGELLARYVRKWTARTSCRRGYRAPICGRGAASVRSA